MVRVRNAGAMPLAVGLAMTLMLAGCATPETRVRNGLMQAGVPRALSACMAERMVDRLSLLQLRRLGRLGDLSERDARTTSLDQYVRSSRALGDPEIIAVVSSSAAICALRR